MLNTSSLMFFSQPAAFSPYSVGFGYCTSAIFISDYMKLNSLKHINSHNPDYYKVK